MADRQISSSPAWYAACNTWHLTNFKQFIRQLDDIATTPHGQQISSFPACNRQHLKTLNNSPVNLKTLVFPSLKEMAFDKLKHFTSQPDDNATTRIGQQISSFPVLSTVCKKLN